MIPEMSLCLALRGNVEETERKETGRKGKAVKNSRDSDKKAETEHVAGTPC